MHDFRFLALKVVAIFLVGAMMIGPNASVNFSAGNCISPGVGIFMGATCLFFLVLGLDLGTYALI